VGMLFYEFFLVMALVTKVRRLGDKETFEI
jgi:hypothetical protein